MLSFACLIDDSSARDEAFELKMLNITICLIVRLCFSPHTHQIIISLKKTLHLSLIFPLVGQCLPLTGRARFKRLSKVSCYVSQVDGRCMVLRLFALNALIVKKWFA